MGISDIIPIPVKVDAELEKWSIFGRPALEIWFTTTEKIHQIIDMGPIKNIFNWSRKNSLYFLFKQWDAAGVEMAPFGSAPYDCTRFGSPEKLTAPNGCDDHLRLHHKKVPACY